MPEVPTRVMDPHRDQSRMNGADALRSDEIPCAEEQIRVPGTIQPHGFLLGVDPDQETVLFASENVSEFLKLPLKLILGSSLELFLDRELMASVRTLRCAIDPEGMVSYLGAFHLGGELYSVLTHRVDGNRILEFERQDRLVGSEMMNSVITNFVGALSRIETEAELCQAITQQVHDLTRFDRVLLYSFDDAGHGTVLSEANNGNLPSYLHLRFPETDIPAQARALYLANTVRIIPNAHYTPVPLRGIERSGPDRLDMSLCVLRSVSPVHLEYMRNMGTMSSMSVSIVCEGKLWGLISAHNAEPKAVPFLIRSACDMLTKIVGTQLNSFRKASNLRAMVQLHNVQRTILTQMAAENDYIAAISRQMPSLLEVTEAAGAVLAVDDHLDCFGLTPPNDVVHKVVEWLEGHPKFELFATNHLGAEVEWAQEVADTASGLLAIRISDVRRRFVLWFRPEVVRTVQWAGEPVKQVDADRHLHPRNSFSTWKEILRGQGKPWTAAEIESARDFRNAVTTISLRRAEEEAELSQARFNKLTHALPVKVFTVTDEGMLTYVNERWKKAGLNEHGLWYGSSRIHPEDADRCSRGWQEAVLHERPVEEEVRLHDTGGEYWNLVRLIPYRREGAVRAGWIGTCVDLTERKQRELALRVTEKLTLTGRMTSFLAHEINNPLEAITNLLFLLKQEMPEHSAAGSYFTMLDAELERISGTVKQTLRWSSENSGKRTTFPVNSLFQDVVRLLGAKVRNRRIEITLHDDQNVDMFGIAGQIRQIIVHLVSNALDAVNVGGHVQIGAEYVEGGVELWVQDDGAGMSEQEISHLFKPFYSTKGDLGNGLGLYISKEIADRHQGHFVVESATGSGTRVRLFLPKIASI